MFVRTTPATPGLLNMEDLNISYEVVTESSKVDLKKIFTVLATNAIFIELKCLLEK